MSKAIVIVGASARAAAFSARRAGLSPVTADLFADVDLQANCPTSRVERYPTGLLKVMRALPAAGEGGSAAWMYTGGLENWPRLVARLAAARTLYGNGPDVLRRVRDPAVLSKVLADGGFLFPETLVPCRDGTAVDRLPLRGKWLCKPRRSSGGLGIRVWRGEWADQAERGGHYFQRRIAGTPCAAVFVAAGSESSLLGVAGQLIGPTWCGVGAFRYAGSIGPMSVSASIRQTFEAIGRHLSRQFGLVGLFGVDAVVRDDEVWVIEVNPRYTASIEILERALGVPTVAWHVRACREGRLPAETTDEASPGSAARSTSTFGKAILFAERDVVVLPEFGQYVERQNAGRDWPRIADVPAVGSRIAGGWPITTVFAAGRDAADVVAELRQRSGEVRERLTM